MRDVLEALLAELRSARRAVLATVVRTAGSTPREPGAKMLVRADGTILGTVGGGVLEAAVRRDAEGLLASSASAPALRRYVLDTAGDGALGAPCGGEAEVLLEPAGPGDRLVIFGAGHVGLALARLAAAVGFACEIVDDRAEYVEAARHAGIGTVLRCAPSWDEGVPALGPGCFVAVVTRTHETDLVVLRRIAGAPLRYLGVIGSRRKRAEIEERLLADGASPEQIARLSCPIGLPIGGKSPEEIAVSVVAELVQVRHRR